MKIFWLLLLFLFSTSNLNSQDKSVIIPLIYEPFSYVSLPPLGIGHYLNKDYKNGVIFTLFEGVPFYFAKKMGNKFSTDTIRYSLQSNDKILYREGMRVGTSPEDYFWNRVRTSLYTNYYNTTGIDEFIAYRNLRNNELHKIPLSNESAWSLSISPFKWKYIKEPELFIPLILTAGFNIYDNYNKPKLWEVTKINFFGKEINPGIATTGNLLLEFVAISLVAMSEEMLYRGILQTELSERVSKDFGLIASSIIFGLVHMRNHDLVYSIRAGIAGLYLGWQYQKYNYDLGRTIALHFYIDFTPSVVSSLLNPLGLRYSYSVTK